MFDRPTLRDLVTRTLADALSRLADTDQLRRADATVYARVLAGASHEMHGHLQWIAEQVIYDTADAEFLERWASLWKITRKPAAAAQGSVTASGAGLVPAGTLYRRGDGGEFAALASSAVPGVVPVQAVAVGADGNTPAGTELSLMTPIAGVSTVAVVAEISGGADEELDASLRDRFLARIRRAPNGGSAGDYVQWALQVPGVTRAWVFPQELGASTVTVRFVRDGDTPIIPDALEVQAVQDHLNVVRPVTAQVHAFAPTAVPLPFSILLAPSTPEARAAVAASLADLLQREAAPGATILLSHIREAISTAAGERDHTLTVPAANVVHTPSQMAVMGAITWL